MDKNWGRVTEKVEAQDIPYDANLLSTHFVFKINKTEQGERTLKASLVVHGNRDDEKEEVCKDAIADEMMMTIFVISLGMIMNFSFGVADIKGAFIQNFPSHRDIYITPPSSYKKRVQVYWKLLALAYGVCDDGIQWLKTSDAWITKIMGIKRLAGDHQLFVERVRNEK